MTEHYTKNTVEVDAFCKPCGAFTRHNVVGGRKGSCLECIAKLEKSPRREPAAVQQGLFNK